MAGDLPYTAQGTLALRFLVQRLMAGQTQEQRARELRVTRDRYAQWESGRNLDSAIALFHAAGTNITASTREAVSRLGPVPADVLRRGKRHRRHAEHADRIAAEMARGTTQEPDHAEPDPTLVIEPLAVKLVAYLTRKYGGEIPPPDREDIAHLVLVDVLGRHAKRLRDARSPVGYACRIADGLVKSWRVDQEFQRVSVAPLDSQGRLDTRREPTD